jgi:hypothetical protein
MSLFERCSRGDWRRVERQFEGGMSMFEWPIESQRKQREEGRKEGMTVEKNLIL